MFNIVRLESSAAGCDGSRMFDDVRIPGINLFEAWWTLPTPQSDRAVIASHARRGDLFTQKDTIGIRSGSERCAIQDLSNFYRWWPAQVWRALCDPKGNHSVHLRVIQVQDPHAVRIGERQVVYPLDLDRGSQLYPVLGMDPDFIETILPQHFDRWDIYLGPGADHVAAEYR